MAIPAASSAANSAASSATRSSRRVLVSGEETAIASAMALLVHYYDLAPASARLLLNKWIQRCSAEWARAAVIEALYQGRYRPVSVEQILAFWLRRGRLTRHFTHEFEALISVPLKQEVAQQQAAQLISLNQTLADQAYGAQSRVPMLKAQADPETVPMPAPLRQRSPQMHQPPIDQFTPAEDPSGFSERLQEVAQQFQFYPSGPIESGPIESGPIEAEHSMMPMDISEATVAIDLAEPAESSKRESPEIPEINESPERDEQKTDPQFSETSSEFKNNPSEDSATQ